jgi:hypothetical protein
MEIIIMKKIVIMLMLRLKVQIKRKKALEFAKSYYSITTLDKGIND